MKQGPKSRIKFTDHPRPEAVPSPAGTFFTDLQELAATRVRLLREERRTRGLCSSLTFEVGGFLTTDAQIDESRPLGRSGWSLLVSKAPIVGHLGGLVG